jgi:ferric-dicitrate binding protein FerR (iron transport regulator)
MKRMPEGRMRQSPTLDEVERFIRASQERPDRAVEGDEHRIHRIWNALNSTAVGERLANPRRREPEDGSPLYQSWLAETVAEEPRASGSLRSSTMWALAAAVGGVALVGFYLTYGSRLTLWHMNPNVAQSYSTTGVQTRSVELPDGSRMTLGARTQLSVHYTDERRAIELDRGEALFTVARNPHRPFVVLAGAGAITAVGTQFDVSRELDSGADRVTVVVKDGVVEVGPPGAQETHVVPMAPSTWTPARVKRGQGISYDAAGPKGQVAEVDAETVAAWVEGRLEYSDVPLRVVIPRVSRYHEKPIVLADEAAGEIPFTGSVFAGQIDSWLHALQTVYPVEITESPDRIVIRSRRTPQQP